jgi:hypothetical protein
MGRSKRWGIRSLVVVAVSFVTVVALASAAFADIRTFTKEPSKVADDCKPQPPKELHFASSNGVSYVTCIDPGPPRSITSCVNSNCMEVTRGVKGQKLLDQLRAQGATDVKPVTEGHSKVWVVTGPKNVDAVNVTQGDACSALGGESFASADGGLGGCRTPKGTIVCAGTTCSGFANSVKDAASTLKRVKTSLKTSATTTPGGATTTSGSTTTTSTTTTTTTPPRR